MLNHSIADPPRVNRFGVEYDRLRAGSHTALPVTIMKCRRLEAALEIILILLEAGCKPNLDNVRLAALRVPQIQPILLHAATNGNAMRAASGRRVARSSGDS